MEVFHQRCSGAFTWDQFHKKCPGTPRGQWVKDRDSKSQKSSHISHLYGQTIGFSLLWIFREKSYHVKTEPHSGCMDDKDLPTLHSQYHGCWCPGDTSRQGISSHSIDLAITEYSTLNTRRVKSAADPICQQISDLAATVCVDIKLLNKCQYTPR